MKGISLAAVALLLVSTSHAAAPIKLKSIPLDEFMHGQLTVPITLPIPVPATYEWAELSRAPLSYSYWMRPGDVAGAEGSGDLPVEGGYMYGKISMNVGYDRQQDVFMGVDDAESMAKLKGGFTSISAEHFTYDGHPVLLMSMQAAGSGKLLYAMYVGLNVGTNALFISMRPPGNSKAIGDYIWDTLKKDLAKAKPAAKP